MPPREGAEEKSCLLFCDTFVHETDGENPEDMQLDLVGFLHSVAITELRVIPIGCKVHPDIHDRLGDTTPSSCHLELFVKNLNQPAASVFERLGVLEYEEGKSIQLIVNALIPTNAVLLRGKYQKLTVCIYGNFTKLLHDPATLQLTGVPPLDCITGGMAVPGAPTGGLPSAVAQMQALAAGQPLPPHLQNWIQPVVVPTPAVDGHVPVPVQGLTINTGAPAGMLIDPNFQQQQGQLGQPPAATFQNSPREGARDNSGSGFDYRNNNPRDSERTGDRRDKRDDNRERFDDRSRDRFRRNDNRTRTNDGDSSSGGTKNEPSSKDVQKLKQGDLFEPLSPDSDFFDKEDQDGSKTNTPTDGKPALDGETGYEDIDSDEDLDEFDFFENTAGDLQNFQDLCETDAAWTSLSLSFDPYQCQLAKLEKIAPLNQSKFEISVQEMKSCREKGEEIEQPPQVKQLQDHIVSDIDGKRDTKWATMLESLVGTLPPALTYLRSHPSHRIREQHFVSIVCEWACYAISIDHARALPLAINIRLLKAGMSVAQLLATSCTEYQLLLVEHGVHEKLISLLTGEHVASSLKLQILRTLDATTNIGVGMDYLMGWCTKNKENDIATTTGSLYEEIVSYLVREPTVRVIAAIRALMKKAHFYEAAAIVQDMSAKLACNEKMKAMSLSDAPADQADKSTAGVETKEETKMEPKEVTPPVTTPDTPDGTQSPSGMHMQQPSEQRILGSDLLSESELNNLVTALEAVYEALKDEHLFTQPHARAFPTSIKLNDETSASCRLVMFELLSSRRFLESLAVVTATPLLCEPTVFMIIRDLLLMLISTEEGLHYLSSEPHSLNSLIKTLTQRESSDSVESCGSLMELMNSEEQLEGCSAHQLGLLLVYHLQSLQGIDQLLVTARMNMPILEMDSTENISMLHALYTMTFTTIGRTAVTMTLSMGDNLRCILPFLNGDKDMEVKMKKSVSTRYASVLLLMTLQNSNEVAMLMRFRSELTTIPRRPNDKILEDIAHFMMVVEHIETLDNEAISPLVEAIKLASIEEEFKIGTGTPKSVLTMLRMLRNVAVPAATLEDESKKNLKWQMATLKLYSANAMDVFIQLLQKINSQLLAPWKQQEPFSSSQCTVLLNCVAILIELIDTLLSHLSRVNTFEFRDVRLIQALFQLHVIIYSKPDSAGPLSSLLTRIQSSIVTLLIRFVRGTKSPPQSEEAVRGSAWFTTFREMLVFAVAKPQNFVTGVVLLTELLPVPLPLHSLGRLTDEEINGTMNHRLLAMANFSCLGAELRLLLRTMTLSSCSALQHYLRRVCCQLLDLGSSVATIIVKTLCEQVEEALVLADTVPEEMTAVSTSSASTPTDERKEEDEKKKPLATYLTSNVMKPISLLSYLITQPSGKTALVHLLTSTSEGVTEFPTLVTKLIQAHDKERDKDTQLGYLESVLLPMMEAICDHEISLQDVDSIITIQHLSNTMPRPHVLIPACQFLVTTVNNVELPLSLIMRVISILESLTDHDYGMFYLKRCLVATTCSLAGLLERLVDTVFTKEEAEVYAAISTFIEFIQLLNSPGPEPYGKLIGDEAVMVGGFDGGDKNAGNADGVLTGSEKEGEVAGDPAMDVAIATGSLSRSIFIDGGLLKAALTSDPLAEHPLQKLEKIIESQSSSDESLLPLGQAITTLRMIMIATGQPRPGVPAEVSESGLVPPTATLVEPEPILNAFNKRLISLVLNSVDDERAQSNDWFEDQAPDDVDSDAEMDTVKVDLLALADKFLPNYNLKDEIEKGFVDTSEPKRSKRRAAEMLLKKGDYIDDTKRLRFDVSALNQSRRGGMGQGGAGRGGNFVRNFNNNYNNRGGGFNRGGRGNFNRFNNRGRGGEDHFRQRRQNTSRPPSMHVDDFVNMEQQGSTQMSKPQQGAQSGTDTRNNTDFNARTRSWGSNNNNTNNGFRRPNEGNIPQRNNDWNNRNNRGGFHNNQQNQDRRGGYKPFHNRSSTDWNNQRSNRGQRTDGRTNRGYWTSPKQKDDNNSNNRFGGDNANNFGYREGRGRHQRTFTR